MFLPFQDTVVALQALAKYAALTYSTKGFAEVRVRSQRGFGRKFQVSYQNRLLVQEAALTEVPGKFSVQAHGSCCVFTRVRCHGPCCDNPLLIITSKPKLSVAALCKEMCINSALIPACFQCNKSVCWRRLRMCPNVRTVMLPWLSEYWRMEMLYSGPTAVCLTCTVSRGRVRRRSPSWKDHGRFPV